MSTNSQPIIAVLAPDASLSLVEQRRELLAILNPDPSYTRVEGLMNRPDRFRQWLAAKPAGEVVGFPESLWSCPIANYLRDGGVNYPVVGPATLRWDYDKGDPRIAPRYMLPGWAAHFVNMLDSTGAFANGVTAVRALATLESVAPLDGAP